MIHVPLTLYLLYALASSGSSTTTVLSAVVASTPTPSLPLPSSLSSSPTSSLSSLSSSSSSSSSLTAIIQQQAKNNEYNVQQLNSTTISSALGEQPDTKPIIKEPDKQALVAFGSKELDLKFTNNATSARPARHHKICTRIDIRNYLKDFEKLKGCTVIDGALTIALVRQTKNTHPYGPEDYENVTFPDLLEIKDYLLFFRVEGLTSISKMFPNLAVIRGRDLVSNYALIIYEMMNLQEINLPSLVDILQGSVRLESNPNLCHASTVNWDRICKKPFTKHFIKDNSQRCSNTCPKYCHRWSANSISLNEGAKEEGVLGDYSRLGTDDRRFCWNSTTCHNACHNCSSEPDAGCIAKKTCCSPQCAGGCFQPNNPDQCFSCKNVRMYNTCVEKCAPDLYELNGRCLKKDECIAVYGSDTYENKCYAGLPRKPLKLPNDEYGRCYDKCPSHYEENPLNKHECILCPHKGKCRRTCNPPQRLETFVVSDISSLKDLRGCNVINGSLDISIQGGTTIVRALEETFQELEEIDGFLKITRTTSLLTLGFFKNLKYIRGSRLDRTDYSFSVINNNNLQELFMFNNSELESKQLHIERGKLSIHLNPKLCPYKIERLKTYANVPDWDSNDVSTHTNGDKEACNVDKLEVTLKRITSKIALIEFDNYALKLNDPRSLLSYLIYYREYQYSNLTIFDGRDGCSNDAWETLEEPAHQTFHQGKLEDKKQVVVKLKPATRYGLYVKTFTILAHNKGAISDILYFTSAPHTPGYPRQLVAQPESNSVTISWFPPSTPNGEIASYSLTIAKLNPLLNSDQLGFCDSIDDLEAGNKVVNTATTGKTSHLFTSPTQSNGSSVEPSSSSNCDSKASGTPINAETLSNQITFQDIVIDNVYGVDRPACPELNTNNRRKRSVNQQQTSETLEALTKDSNILNSPIERLEEPSLHIKAAQINQRSQKNSTYNLTFNDTLTQNNYTINLGDIDLPDNKQFTFHILDLRHASQYQIEIKACHRKSANNTIVQVSRDYSLCSLSAITNVKTLPIDENDRIHNPRYLQGNNSHESLVFWDQPANPNGIILGYRLRMRSISNPKHYTYSPCLSTAQYERDNGYKLTGIVADKYLLSVQALTSDAENRLWSEPEIEFEIPSESIFTPINIAFYCIMLFVFIAIITYGTCYYQRNKNAANGLLYASVNPDYHEYIADDWEVDKNNVIVGGKLGNGTFGEVYRGKLITDKAKVDCAVKTVPITATAKHRMDFLREASTMKEFNTHHIVKLLGVVSVSTPVYVIMEFMLNGDLKNYLRKEREKFGDAKENPDKKYPVLSSIYLMACQIADGMAYLASKKYVHRDLAARNCLVADDRTVKIGDFGLTRDVYQNEYYRRNTEAKLPVRWMAPEALSDNIYTTASDVWSYGIVLWEMATYSAHPYPGFSNDEVVKRVIAGHTLERPQNCPNLLFTVMQKCWRKNPSDRPSFIDILDIFLLEAENEGEMSPESFYKKNKAEPHIISQSSPEESLNTTGTESYPLLSWTAARTNGLQNNRVS